MYILDIMYIRTFKKLKCKLKPPNKNVIQNKFLLIVKNLILRYVTIFKE